MDSIIPPEDTPLKRCPTCPEGQQWHPATTEFFNREKVRKDGLKTQCKICTRAYLQNYRNRPEIQECTRAYTKDYQQRPDVKERVRLYNQRPERKEQIRQYRSRPEVQEQRLINGRTYMSRPDIQEHMQANRKEYANRPEVQERHRIGEHIRRVRKRGVQGTYTPDQIQEQLKHQKHRCYYAACGFSKFKQRKNGAYIYHIEHTYPLSRVAGTDIPANDISYLVLSCEECNKSKGKKFPWEWPEGGRLL